MPATPAPRLRPPAGDTVAAELARSALAPDGTGGGAQRFRSWFAERLQHVAHRTERIPLEALAGWHTEPGTGNVVHDTGRFFSVEGLDVHVPGAPVERWSQPILCQPEVGILGILAKEFDGVLHFLMQAKFEPGNAGGLQLSPTVQATRSNYTRVHGGRSVRYVEYFRDTAGHQVIADVLQSEQGAWFYRKRNRNMVVKVRGEVPLADDFHWLTLGQLHRLLEQENLVNMDARTVLACLPFAAHGPHPLARLGPAGPGDFPTAVVRSLSAAEGSAHSTTDLVGWITGLRARTEVHTRRAPLDGLPHWHRRDGVVSHDSGRFFDVVGVDVTAGSREVAGWTQPMIEPRGRGVAAFVVRRIDGVLHVLAHARVEPGYVDVVELAPTVQCTPQSLDALPPGARPRLLSAVLDAAPGQVRFAADLSEEGGRFLHAVNRYLVVETEDGEGGVTEGEHHRWMTLHQLDGLLRHSHYVNVQARTLVACLHGLAVPAALPAGGR
ncbi:NDP-hexose 2,3-dehydratase family protein [Streptomyces sp. NPDC049555]|uniref:NDP-hexose 2,3-dehydratase family protein n=1 Tax=Streptomyces sp. NPDC049555 TaxID=3154930 RepID=UPI00343C58EC